MDEFTSIRVFITAVEENGFSAAGRRLGMSASTISRHITSLEEELGVRVLNRNTRRQSLTDAGRMFYERVKIIDKSLAEAKLETQSAHESCEGVLRVSLRTSTGPTVIVPALPMFLEKYPKLKLEIILTDERQDLISRNIDVAIWAGELPDSELVARRLLPSKRVLCASPKYLERHGIPVVPEDLQAHNCLMYSRTFYGSTWYFSKGQESLSVDVAGNLSADNGLVLLSAALNCVGIILVQEVMVKDLIRDGSLVPLLSEYEIAPAELGNPLFAVFPSSRRLSARVRAFVDFLVALFNEENPSGAKSQAGGSFASITNRSQSASSD